MSTQTEIKAVWERHPGLVWSNRSAGDTSRICAALLKPRFARLLDIAGVFGPDRVEREWKRLLEEEEIPARVQRVTDRILRNIRYGYEQACREHG